MLGNGSKQLLAHTIVLLGSKGEVNTTIVVLLLRQLSTPTVDPWSVGRGTMYSDDDA